MKIIRGILLFIAFCSLPLFAQAPPPDLPAAISWAYYSPDKNPPPGVDQEGPLTLPGSSKTYTQDQIDNLFNPPDWFPEEHGPLPAVVAHGSGKAPACASCHLMSGYGHPESADLAGLPVSYLMRQLADFKSGARNGSGMAPIGKNLSEEDAQQASQWFASLKPAVWFKVAEAETVPKFFIGKHYMRRPIPGAGTEPLGDRIIELPQDPERAPRRDPHSGFIAYVPVGSLAKGEALVKTGGAGKTMTCTSCHGKNLGGSGIAPRITGLSPSYVARQLYMFQTGVRNGEQAEQMKPVVEHLDFGDMLNLAAYLASLPPAEPPAPQRPLASSDTPPAP